MKTFALLMLTGLLLTACSQSGLVKQDTASTLYLPPVGSTIELKKPLSVPGGRTRIFIQGGKVSSLGGVDQYRPNCNFEVRTLADQPREIKPEDFPVVRVQRVTEEVVQLELPRRVAGLGLAGMDSDSSLPMVVRGVHLWIGSDTQPDVMRMTCRGAFADAWAAEMPSIDQMNRALGDYASLQLP